MVSPVPAPQMTRQQWGIVLLIGAVQFVNILDFVIVMPLGPDFAVALGIPESHLGYVGGAYTAAACVSGLLGSLFLDRFDRRKALAVAMLGLVVGTAAGALAVDLPTLLLARVVAGRLRRAGHLAGLQHHRRRDPRRRCAAGPWAR